MTVAALFVSPRGPYPRLLGPEQCWGEDRNAMRYRGPDPVVAHPPCQLWVNLAAVNWKRYGRQRPAWYANGDPEARRQFRYAVGCVTGFGGVLEHPAQSWAWQFHGLPEPPEHGWVNRGHLWACEVWQSAYGHRARKRTWLLYSGHRPPFDLDWSRKPGTHQVGWFDRSKPTLSKREALVTPEPFARALIALAEHSKGP